MTPHSPRTDLPARRADGPAPLLSVIVPTYNSAAILGPALESLAQQAERDFEVVVSDGASKDGTVALAESFRDRLPALLVLSRPDKGVYDAVNLGLAASRGRWVLVLGSDDRLSGPQTLLAAAQALRGSAASFVYGDVRVLGKNWMCEDGGRYGGRFDLTRLLGQNICQQACFYRRDVFDRLGLFDIRYRLWADWDFAQRAFVAEPTQWIDLVVADYAASGISTGVLDRPFIDDRARRLFRLWRARPASAAVPLGVLRQVYWHLRTTWLQRRASN